MGGGQVFEADGLRRVFRRGDDEIRALDCVSLQVGEGEFVAVTGPSGCGKTTLLHVLGLLDAGFEGALAFGGRDVRRLTSRARARLRLTSIGFVFQGFHLLDALDARDNAALPRWRLSGDRRAARAHADELLERLGVAHRARHPVRKLSGGEMQRVALARALANDPAVVLADEPTGNLDAENTAAIVALLQGLVAEGRTVVAVTHEPELLAAASRTIALRWGSVETE